MGRSLITLHHYDFCVLSKSNFFQPNILNENLETYEQEIRTAISKVGTMRDSMLNVDSTHKLRIIYLRLPVLKD